MDWRTAVSTQRAAAPPELRQGPEPARQPCEHRLAHRQRRRLALTHTLLLGNRQGAHRQHNARLYLMILDMDDAAWRECLEAQREMLRQRRR